MERPRRAGDPLDDLCRACKTVREHHVLAVDAEGNMVSVQCGFCGSQHRYRGGGGPARSTPRGPTREAPSAWALVSERERSGGAMGIDEGSGDLELLLRRIIREEAGLTPVAPADKWKGGELILRPGRPGVQEKSWPIETFFHKIVMIRNRLRSLEQQVNAAEIPQELKVKLQGYVTASYGSLTSFNVLFADDEDRFKGSGK